MGEFLNFVNQRYIKEDFDILKPIGKVIVYPVWIVRSILVYILSFVFFPIVYLHMFKCNFKNETEHIEKLLVKMFNVVDEKK